MARLVPFVVLFENALLRQQCGDDDVARELFYGIFPSGFGRYKLVGVSTFRIEALALFLYQDCSNSLENG